MLAQGIGVPLTGYLRDATGSYGPVLAAVIVAGLIACCACGCRSPCSDHPVRVRSAPMHGLVVRWLVSAVALYITAQIVRGIEVHGIASLLFAAITIGILNALVRPVILLLTLPLSVLTLGLFVLVVNAGMLWLASEVVKGFEVHGFWSALGGWLLMSFFTFVINLLIGETGRVEIVHVREIIRF